MTEGFLNLCFKLRFLRAPAVSNPRLLSGLVPVASRLMPILFAVCLFALAATVSHHKESRVAIAHANDHDRDSRYIAPFVPTPEEVVVRMLELAEITPGDVLYDLGSGDGRIVIAAAKRYGIKAVGFEINPALVEESRRTIKQEGLENLVEIREQDIRVCKPVAGQRRDNVSLSQRQSPATASDPKPVKAGFASGFPPICHGRLDAG